MPTKFLPYDYTPRSRGQVSKMLETSKTIYVTSYRPGFDDADYQSVNFYTFLPGVGGLVRINSEIRDYVLKNKPGVTQLIRQVTENDSEELDFHLDYFIEQTQQKSDSVYLPDIITRDIWEGEYWEELADLISRVMCDRAGVVTIMNLSV